MAAGQMFCVGFGPPRLAATDIDSAALWPQQVRDLGAAAPPQPAAGAALLLDLTTNTLLFAQNHEQRLAPASTTKMMTALVALERGRLDDEVLVEAADLTTPSYAGLYAGETWTLEDLLYALLLPSDNAAARVIARHIAGSEAAFVALMNEQAAAWGLRNTHFVNPHGLDAPQHYSSAYDLAQIALHGLANPLFASMVATREHRVGARTLANQNQLLGSYEGMAGVKTGTTDEAGECLISLVERPTGRALCVIMRSDDRYRDSRLLLDHYFASYVTVPLGLGPKGLNGARRRDGSRAVLALRDRRRALVPRWQLPWLRVQLVGPAVLPQDPQAAAGVARFTAGRVLLAEMPVYGVAP